MHCNLRPPQAPVMLGCYYEAMHQPICSTIAQPPRTEAVEMGLKKLGFMFFYRKNL